MTRVEMLLVILAEEAAEVVVAAEKALRFGLDNHHPDRKETNAQELYIELTHIDAVQTLLYKDGVLFWRPDFFEKSAKMERIEHYLNVSRECGILQEANGDNERK